MLTIKGGIKMTNSVDRNWGKSKSLANPKVDIPKAGAEIIPIPEGLKIERDVMVSMPDGVKLACDVVRPDRPGRFPVIMAMTPYNKDMPPTEYFAIAQAFWQGWEYGHMKISMLTSFEAPDPGFWVPHGYVTIIIDCRGAGKSQGEQEFCGSMEMDDLARMIEWAGTQEWSNGNVGLMGVSYLAWNQWHVASRRPPPPHLKAIIPWEGVSDMYRDSMFWGGIPETTFYNLLLKDLYRLKNLLPDEVRMDPVRNQNLIRMWPRLELITVPALICASWSDKGLHTRGSFEAYRRISSKEKWLYTHGGKKWERFYSEDALKYQKKFFDHYLKGVEDGWQDTPRVRLEVRETRDEYAVRFENEFPLGRTQYKKLYLNAHDGFLSPNEAGKEGKVVYNSTQGGDACFAITFDEDTELTGYMKAKLWVSAKDSDDMDLFVGVRKFDTKGNEVQFRGMNGWRGCVAARGQMRVSQRELDEKLSTPWQPVQKFEGEKKLTPGEIVPVEIALLPSSTLFRKGESLRLYIQGHDLVDNPNIGYRSLINKGDHVIYTGGKYDSYLQVPKIPRK
jgi:predicted acyl esterase